MAVISAGIDGNEEITSLSTYVSRVPYNASRYKISMPSFHAAIKIASDLRFIGHHARNNLDQCFFSLPCLVLSCS